MDEYSRRQNRLEICMIEVDGKKLCIDPSLPVLRVLSRKYSLLVMLSIKINGINSNFNNVKSHIPLSSSTIISKRLRELLDSGLIYKNNTDGRLTYSLTKFGTEVLTSLEPFIKLVSDEEISKD